MVTVPHAPDALRIMIPLKIRAPPQPPGRTGLEIFVAASESARDKVSHGSRFVQVTCSHGCLFQLEVNKFGKARSESGPLVWPGPRTRDSRAGLGRGLALRTGPRASPGFDPIRRRLAARRPGRRSLGKVVARRGGRARAGPAESL